MSHFNLISNKRLHISALATAMAITLAGCGGGGGSVDTIAPQPSLGVQPTEDNSNSNDGNTADAATDDGIDTSSEEAQGNYEIFLSSSNPSILLDKGSFVSVTAKVVGAETFGIIANQEVKFSITNPSLTGVTSASPALVTTDSEGNATIKLQINSKLTTEQKKYLKETGVKITASSGLGTKSTIIKGTEEAVISEDAKYDVFFSTSTSTLNTGTGIILLSARVTDEDGGVQPGVPVKFKINNVKAENGLPNGLSFASASDVITDENGLATITLVQNNQNINNQLEHTAKVSVDVNDGAASSSIDINVTGTEVTGLLMSSKTLTTGETFDLSGSLVDGNSSAIYTGYDDNTSAGNNAKIILMSGTTELAEAESNAKGQFSFTNINVDNLNTSNGSEIPLSLKVVGEQGVSQTIDNIAQITVVSSQDLTLRHSDVVLVGNKTTVTVRAPGKNGETVLLSTAKGLLSGSDGTKKTTASSVVKNEEATFTLYATVSGIATLQAQILGSDSIAVTSSVSLQSTTPKKLLVQSGQAEIGTNSATTITAKVLDESDTPVPNTYVSFTISKDGSQGLLDNSLVKTNKDGVAVVTYTAGDNPTASDGVSIISTVYGVEVNGKIIQTSGEVDSVETNLTVQTKASTISFGLSDKIQVGSREVYYLRNGSASVSNNGGQPARNQQVTISLRPKYYYKGRYVYGYVDKLGIVNDKEVWYTTTKEVLENAQGKKYLGGDRSYTIQAGSFQYQLYNTIQKCENEDVNYNSILDTGEDINSNNQLEPGFRATILIDGNQATSSNGVYKFTTDSTGKVNFQIRYLKSDAHWMTMEMKASTEVDGSESNTSQLINFPVLIDDVTDEIRPNLISPFGEGASCEFAQ